MMMTHSPASSNHHFHFKIVLFCDFESEDGHSDRQTDEHV